MARADADTLQERLRRIDGAKTVYVRAYGASLIVGRREPLGPRGGLVPDDRIKLAPVGTSRYSVRARDWKGRYGHTGLEATLAELPGLLTRELAHLLAPLFPTKPPKRTSGGRH